MMNTRMTQQQVDDLNDELDATQFYRQPCGCPACDDGVQQGHFACAVSSERMLAAEREGRVFRAYDNGGWRWYWA